MEIFTDCSFSEFDKIAGIGIYIKDGIKQRSYSLSIPAKTNNYGEMWAIYIASILTGGKPATIYTDSQTALDFINGTMKIKTRGYFARQEQYDMQQMMRVLAYKVNHVNPGEIKFVKVKGHDRTVKEEFIGNHLADNLAKNGLLRSLECGR